MDHEDCEGFGRSFRNPLHGKFIYIGSCAHCQLSNDPSLSSLPLLSMFLKSYGRPFLGLASPQHAKQQVSSSTETGSLSKTVQNDALMEGVHHDPREEDEIVEKEIRDRFKRMCEGYFDSISKKLVKEHLVRFL